MVESVDQPPPSLEPAGSVPDDEQDQAWLLARERAKTASLSENLDMAQVNPGMPVFSCLHGPSEACLGSPALSAWTSLCFHAPCSHRPHVQCTSQRELDATRRQRSIYKEELEQQAAKLRTLQNQLEEVCAKKVALERQLVAVASSTPSTAGGSQHGGSQHGGASGMSR